MVGKAYTMTANVFTLLWGGEPESVTRTFTKFVVEASATSGVQLNRPVAASMLAPRGAPGSRLKDSACAGTSTSVAVAVKCSVFSTTISLVPMAASTGASLTEFTVSVTVTVPEFAAASSAR